MFVEFLLFNAEYYLYKSNHYDLCHLCHWPLKDGLRIGHLNINHLINKTSDASHIVHNSKPYGRGFHIFCFSESRLNNHMDDKYIAIERFHVNRKDPQIQRETGLAVYVHETMSVTRLTEFEKYGVECIWLEVKLQKKKKKKKKKNSSPGWVSMSKSFRTCKLD